MNVGILRVRLRFPENESLKGKRRVLNSITSKVRSRFNVSIAEVEGQELWQLATLGIVCVNSDSRHANETLSKVVEFIRRIRDDAEFLDYEVELLSA
jgi:hypothetical protein